MPNRPLSRVPALDRDEDMDDEDDLTVVFNKTLATFKTSMGSGVWPEQDSPATANINENLVKTWKRFLYK